MCYLYQFLVVENKDDNKVILTYCNGLIPRIGETLCIPEATNEANISQTLFNRYNVVDVEYSYSVSGDIREFQEIIVTVSK